MQYFLIIPHYWDRGWYIKNCDINGWPSNSKSCTRYFARPSYIRRFSCDIVSYWNDLWVYFHKIEAKNHNNTTKNTGTFGIGLQFQDHVLFFVAFYISDCIRESWYRKEKITVLFLHFWLRLCGRKHRDLFNGTNTVEDMVAHLRKSIFKRDFEFRDWLVGLKLYFQLTLSYFYLFILLIYHKIVYIIIHFK